MERRKGRRRRLIVLAVVGMVFLAHYLGLLPTLVLTVFAVAGVAAGLGLLAEIPALRTLLRKLLKSMERGLSTCE